MSTNNGGPAFPHAYDQADEDGKPMGQGVYIGMSLRDYFAAQALPAVINAVLIGDGHAKDGAPMTEEKFAEQAYFFADAMLKTREL